MENQNTPKNNRIGKIIVNRDLCIGAASCVAVAPSTFELDQENKAVLIRKKGGPSSEETKREDLADDNIDDETLLLAAQSCPTQAIILYDEEGKQIYP
ncbi:MAG: ferredoxin [Parcubacteria group bacterium]|nr:ferredoxin [Parcubacteria group bacterium]